MEERKPCPFCGEAVVSTAKKCRFCGEWIEQTTDSANGYDPIPVARPLASEALIPANSDDKVSVVLQSAGQNKVEVVKIVHDYTGLNLLESKELVDSAPAIIQKGLLMSNAQALKLLFEQVGAEVAIVSEKNQAVETGVISVSVESENANNTMSQLHSFQQPQQIVVNVVNNQSVEQNVSQQQAIIVNNDDSSDNSYSGCMFWELIAISGFVWWSSGSWLAGLLTLIVGTILYFIPYLGAILCFALGAAWGFVIGALVYGIFRSIPAAWIVGIIASLAIGFGHFEAREKDMRDVND